MFRKEQGQAPFPDDFGDEGDGIRRLLRGHPCSGLVQQEQRWLAGQGNA